MSYTYSKRPDALANPAASNATQLSDKSRPMLPNSAMASLYGDTGSRDSASLDAAMQVKLAALNRQRPAAEREADKLSAGVTATTPDQIKEEMGRRMGADFSAVHFHSGPSSVQEGDRMGARAWTKGSNVYFGEGGFDPNVAAHELVHTVQQGCVEGQAGESAPAGTIQMKPNPLKWIKKKIKGGKGETTPQDAASGPEQAPEQAPQAPEQAPEQAPAQRAKRPWEITKEDLKQNHFNPGNIDEVGDIQARIDSAEDPKEAYRIFLEYTGNTTDGLEVEGDADKNVDLGRFKNKLKNMARMVYDYPELKGQVGKMTMSEDGVLGASMSATSTRGGTEKSTLKYNISGEKKGIPNSIMRKGMRLADKAIGYSSSSSAYDGNHELGHTLNSLLFEKSSADSDWKFNRTADQMLQTVLQRTGVKEEEIKRHKKVDMEKKVLPRQVDLKASELSKKGITSGYGETDAGEFFAEAFADVYAHGDKAMPASIELVKLYEEKRARAS